MSGWKIATGFWVRCRRLPVVAPGDDVGQRRARRHGAAVGEQISLLVLITGEALARRVFLREDNVTRDMKRRLVPRIDEAVHAVPGVEAQAGAKIMPGT